MIKLEMSHDLDKIVRNMGNRYFEPNDFVNIMKSSAKPLAKRMLELTPDSLANYAKASSGEYSKAAAASRAKYGILSQSLTNAKSRKKQLLGEHAINVGYRTSKVDKAFVSGWLNNGWIHYKSKKKIVGQRWMQQAEKETKVEVESNWNKETNSFFEKKMNKVFI